MGVATLAFKAPLEESELSAIKQYIEGQASSLYALSEILACGHCGTPYRRVVRIKRSCKKQPVWRCINQIMEMVTENQTCQNQYEYAQAEKQMQSLSAEARQIQNIIDEYKANNDTKETIEIKLLEVKTYLESQPQDILEYHDSLVRQTIDTNQVMNNGYASLKEYTRNGHGGVYMLFTPKGRLYLMKRINKRLAITRTSEPPSPDG